MDAAHGGMPGPLTCMLPFPNLTLIVVGFCRCWNNVDASSLLCEPPYTEPYVRWCGRTAEGRRGGPSASRGSPLAASPRQASLEKHSLSSFLSSGSHSHSSL